MGYSIAHRAIIDAIKILADFRNTQEVANLSNFIYRNADFDYLEERLVDAESKTILSWYFTVRFAKELLGISMAEICDVHPGIHTGAKWMDYDARARKISENLELAQPNIEEMIETRVLGGYTIDNICMPSEGDVVFDAGVFNGNNSLIFSDLVGELGHVHGFEPSPNFYKKAKQNCNYKKNITIHNLGLFSEKKIASFDQREMASRISDGSGIGKPIEVSLTTIDDFVEENGIDRIDFMKFDIEGAEIHALKGGYKTLRRFRPKIMIAAYHTPEDLLEFPKLIDPTGHWYKFYLRHYHVLPRELVLYAIPVRQPIPDWVAS